MVLQWLSACAMPCRSSSESSMVVGGAGKEAKVLGRTQQAHNKMAEELQRVNSDLATALKGLQEVRSAVCPSLSRDVAPRGML